MPRLLIGNVKGVKGDTGAQGERGLAGTIEVGSVQTVSYGSPASVTNSGTEEEAILDFQIPQGAPGAQVTDMSNLVLSTITDSTADYPAFAVSETGSTIFGKIRKFLSDLKTKYVSKSMMTTSTDVDTAGQAVADAKAIKSLNDSLSNTIDSLANKADAADLTALADDYRQKVFCKQWDITIDVSVPANGNALIFSGQNIRGDLPSGAHIISARCAWASNNNIIISQSWLSGAGNLTARAYNPTNAAITVTSATAVAFYYL